MRQWFFNTIYLLAFLLLSPWIAWRAIVQGKSRRGWKQKLLGQTAIGQHSAATRIWLHAVSVGEVHLLEPLIKQLLAGDRKLDLFVSTGTETGFDRAKELFGADHHVFFWPTDFSWAIHRTLDNLRPDLVVLMELELWPNFLRICANRNVNVAVANGRLSEKSFSGYQKFGWLMGSTFGDLAWVGVQNSTYADRFIKLGVDSQRVEVTGNIKFDGLVDTLDTKARLGRELASEFGFDDSHQVVIAGSTQIEDERAALEAYADARRGAANLRLVIVPRHPKRRDEIVNLIREFDFQPVLRSEFPAKPDLAADGRAVLIVDVIGELTLWWSQAAVAFVGGSMGSRGGQNMIEPSAFGVAVCFGENTRNFAATVSMLLAANGAVVVRDADELRGFIERVIGDAEFAAALGTRAREVVTLNQGATGKTVDLLMGLAKKD